MLGIARELRRRGWEVHVAISAPYANLVPMIGCHPEVIGTQADFDRVLAFKNLWHPFAGSRIIFKQAIPEFNLAYCKRLLELDPAKSTVLIAHPLDFAARVYHELHPQVPLFNVHLAPTTLFDPHCPPRVTNFAFEIRRPAKLVDLIYSISDRLLIQSWLRPTIRSLFQMFGNRRVHKSLHAWWTDGTATVGMFPDWFGSPTRPANLMLAGFPLFDGTDESDAAVRADAVRVKETTATFDRPAIAFTIGTAHQHSQQFFQMAIDVCVRLGEPGLLLSSHADQVPERLPDNVAVAGYLPFRLLLPCCRALVHHGGIGTTSQAIAAGIPQVVLPMAFDQFDNAERVVRLGCGDSISQQRVSVGRLATTLSKVIDSASVRETTVALRSRLKVGESLCKVADLIETKFSSPGSCLGMR